MKLPCATWNKQLIFCYNIPAQKRTLPRCRSLMWGDVAFTHSAWWCINVASNIKRYFVSIWKVHGNFGGRQTLVVTCIDMCCLLDHVGGGGRFSSSSHCVSCLFVFAIWFNQPCSLATDSLSIFIKGQCPWCPAVTEHAGNPCEFEWISLQESLAVTWAR